MTEFRFSDVLRWSAGTTLSGPGIVPVGTPVLHKAAAPVLTVTQDIRRLVEHMRTVMVERGGIGLAANQVGAAVQICVHGLTGTAPDAILNPRIVTHEGWSEREEGCLSLKLNGSQAVVRRPNRIVVEGVTLGLRPVRIEAGGYLARVLQHEIDHLRGIEYVQRLTDPERTRVYSAMSGAGVNTQWMPPAPYGSPLFRG